MVADATGVKFLGDVVAWFASGERWRGDFGIPHRLAEHLALCALVIVTAALVAVPTGVALAHLRRGSTAAVNVANIGRAIPSLALLILGVQVWGIGATPAFVALFALAVPPMVTNALVGVREVDPDVREAAVGMGMTRRQLLWRVELPLALPLLAGGIRTAAVQVVATATLAAIVAWGGLGRYIVDGIAQRDFVQVFGGAVLVAGLALATELALAGATRVLLPRPLRARAGRGQLGSSLDREVPRTAFEEALP